MTETYINPSQDQLAALRALDVEGPVVMVNLLRFAPDGGAGEYASYGRQAMPFLQAAGATVRYLGVGVATAIGAEEWDEVVLVEYPSVQAFFEMVTADDYPSAVRSGALVDSRLYATQPRT